MIVQMRPIGSIRPYENNPRNNDGAVEAVIRSIREYGWRQPIVVDSDGIIIVGHTRHKAAIAMGLQEVPVHVAADLPPDKARAYRIADNRVGEIAEWEPQALSSELAALEALGVEMDALGWEPDDLPRGAASSPAPAKTASLSDRFVVPPFTVLDARAGYWQDRKREWLAMGIQSELGRGGAAAPGSSPRPAARLTENGRTARGDGRGRNLAHSGRGER